MKFLSKPTVYYPIILLVTFSALRFINIQLEEHLGFRILSPVVMGIIIGYLFGRQIERERELHIASISDSLSGLYNRSGLDTHISHFFSGAIIKTNASIISIDIDDFKKINDTYGHDIGDIVLSTLGRIIKNNIHTTDIAARSGGDEFIIFLPVASYDVASRVAESIIMEMNSTPIMINSELNIDVHISIGFAAANNSCISKSDLFKLSDQKLYESKYSGKNQICGIQL